MLGRPRAGSRGRCRHPPLCHLLGPADAPRRRGVDPAIAEDGLSGDPRRGDRVMRDKVAIRLLRSGVPGLDEVFGGGIPEFSLNLIVGGSGSGKTTLGHQIMFANATTEHQAIFFTVVGEPPIKMLRYMQQLSFFDT